MTKQVKLRSERSEMPNLLRKFSLENTVRRHGARGEGQGMKCHVNKAYNLTILDFQRPWTLFGQHSEIRLGFGSDMI